MKPNLMLPLMAGVDIAIPELSLTIHPPQIKDIAYMGEQKFFNSVQYICLNKEQVVQDERVLSSCTNFQVLMKVLEQSQDKNKKQDLQTLMLLLFPTHQTIILPTGFLLNAEDGTSQHIDDGNFGIFQDYVREVLCTSSVFQQDNIIYKPANKMAEEIASKMYSGRRKVAEQKSEQSKGASILTRYLSILETAKIVSPFEATNLTLFQVFDLMERYTAFLEWDIDTKVRLAGGKPEKTVESWMRDLHQADKPQAFTNSNKPQGMKIYK